MKNCKRVVYLNSLESNIIEEAVIVLKEYVPELTKDNLGLYISETITLTDDKLSIDPGYVYAKELQEKCAPLCAGIKKKKIRRILRIVAYTLSAAGWLTAFLFILNIL